MLDLCGTHPGVGYACSECFESFIYHCSLISNMACTVAVVESGLTTSETAFELTNSKFKLSSLVASNALALLAVAKAYPPKNSPPVKADADRSASTTVSVGDTSVRFPNDAPESVCPDTNV